MKNNLVILLFAPAILIGCAGPMNNTEHGADTGTALGGLLGCAFEADIREQETECDRARHFKKVASGMVEAAREGASDPIQTAIKADLKASEPEEVPKPINPEEAWKRSALEFFNSDWTPLIEAQEAQAQEEADAAERERRSGLWCG